MTQTLRVKVVLDTDQLHSWAARHHDLGHPSVAAALTVAAHHYEGIDPDSLDPDVDPPAPTYPHGDAVELRNWADWHADGRTAGVAHVLYEAAASAERSPATHEQ